MESVFDSEFQRDLSAEIQIRTLKREDAAELFAMTDRNRGRLRAWLPWLDRSTEVAHSTAYIDYMTALAEKKEALMVGIYVRGTLAGVSSFNKVDWANRTVMIGYWIDEQYAGRGLVTMTTRALCQHAFADLGMRRVEIRCATGNTLSQRVPVRLGFEFEGVLRDAEWLYDRFVSHKVYSLLDSEADRLSG